MKIKRPNIKAYYSLILVSMLIWAIFFFLGYCLVMQDAVYASSASTCSIKNEFETHQLPNEANDPLFFISHNLTTTMIMILGVFNCGLSTIPNLIFNGFYLGGLIKQSLNVGMPLTSIMLMLFPHTIFELPAIWLAGAAGLKGPHVLIRYLRGGEFITKQDVKEFLSLSLTSVILILIAGIIEATITYEITKNLIAQNEYT